MVVMFIVEVAVEVEVVAAPPKARLVPHQQC